MIPLPELHERLRSQSFAVEQMEKYNVQDALGEGCILMLTWLCAPGYTDVDRSAATTGI